MKKTLIILILIFPLLGSCAKKTFDVGISVESYHGGIPVNCFILSSDPKTGKYRFHDAEVFHSFSGSIIICGLKPKNKPVKTLNLSDEVLSVTLEEKHSFRFGRKTYTLRAEGDERTDGYHNDYWYKVKDYRLYLSDGKSEQLLTTVSYFDGTSPDILWAGDLDRDGKPDFVLRTAKWYEDERIELYLSSIAKKGELVKLADYIEYFREDHEDENEDESESEDEE